MLMVLSLQGFLKPDKHDNNINIIASILPCISIKLTWRVVGYRLSFDINQNVFKYTSSV